MAEETKRIKMKRDYEKNSVTFTFPNGKTLSLSCNDLQPDIKEKLCLYGLGVKLQRSYAGADNFDIAYTTLEKQLQSLKEGQWATARPNAKENKKEAVLEIIREAKGELRQKVVEMFKASGTFKKLNISDEDLKGL